MTLTQEFEWFKKRLEKEFGEQTVKDCISTREYDLGSGFGLCASKGGKNRAWKLAAYEDIPDEEKGTMRYEIEECIEDGLAYEKRIPLGKFRTEYFKLSEGEEGVDNLIDEIKEFIN